MKVYDERNYAVQLDRKREEGRCWTLLELEYFVSGVYTRSKLSVESFVYGFCLFLRIAHFDGNFALGFWTWRLALMSCFVLAEKVLEDESHANSCYVGIWNGAIDFHAANDHAINLANVNEMEAQLLVLLKFQALVSLEFYQQVCRYFKIATFRFY